MVPAEEQCGDGWSKEAPGGNLVEPGKDIEEQFPELEVMQPLGPEDVRYALAIQVRIREEQLRLLMGELQDARRDPLISSILGKERLRRVLLQMLQGIYSDTNTSIAIMMMDMDHFKLVNDVVLHVLADRLLVEIGERLNSAFRHQDGAAWTRVEGESNRHRDLIARYQPVEELLDGPALGRWGGDEFVVAATYPSGEDHAVDFLRRISVRAREAINSFMCGLNRETREELCARIREQSEGRTEYPSCCVGCCVITGGHVVTVRRLYHRRQRPVIRTSKPPCLEAERRRVADTYAQMQIHGQQKVGQMTDLELLLATALDVADRQLLLAKRESKSKR